MAMDMAWGMGAKVKKGWGFVPSRYSERSSPRAGSGLVWLRTMRSTRLENAEMTLPLPAASIFGQGLGVYLEVPGVVCLAGFQNGLGRSKGVAAALEDDAVEIGLVSVVVGVAFVDGQFVGGELDDAVGARAQGGEVLLIAASGSGADTIGELGLAENRDPGPDEGGVGVGGGGVEGYLDGRVVQGLHGCYVGE